MILAIVDADDPEYWDWITIPEARTNPRVLSPRTRYSAYIVFKKWDLCFGFDDIPILAGVGVVEKEASRRFICFDTGVDDQFRAGWRDLVKPEEREDGWMEIELGEFFNEMSSDEIKMSALETEGHSWKRGLIVQGIEIRPAKIW